MKRPAKSNHDSKVDALVVIPNARKTGCQQCPSKTHALWKHQGKLLCYGCLMGRLYNQPIELAKGGGE